MNSGRK